MKKKKQKKKKKKTGSNQPQQHNRLSANAYLQPRTSAK